MISFMCLPRAAGTLGGDNSSKGIKVFELFVTHTHSISVLKSVQAQKKYFFTFFLLNLMFGVGIFF